MKIVFLKTVVDHVESLREDSILAGQEYAGLMGLAQDAANWWSAIAYSTWLQNINNQIDHLLARIVANTTYVVPPRPNEVNDFMFYNFYGALSSQDYDRMTITMMQQSAAFWGSHP